MLDKTPLEMALEREGQIEYCDECEFVRVVDNTVFCGLSGKLLHPMMFLRGQGFGPARRCAKGHRPRVSLVCLCFAFAVLFYRVGGPVAPSPTMGAGHFVIYAAAHAFEVVALLEHRGAPAAKVLRFGHQSLTPLKLSRTWPPFSSNSTVW